MTQLIISGITLPEASNGKYQCYPEILSTDIEMISGRIVSENRGHVQIITYSYDYFGDTLMRQLLTVLRSGESFTVQYLPDDGDALITSTFKCKSFKNPTFAFSRNGTPRWHDIEFTLREVKPHD